MKLIMCVLLAYSDDVRLLGQQRKCTSEIFCGSATMYE